MPEDIAQIKSRLREKNVKGTVFRNALKDFHISMMWSFNAPTRCTWADNSSRQAFSKQLYVHPISSPMYDLPRTLVTFLSHRCET